MFCPHPHEICYNKLYIYIKSSILSLLIQIFAKEYYQKYAGGGGLSMFCPHPHEICYNKLYIYIYIKSRIVSLLIQILSKEYYQKYGGGANYCLPPPLHEI